MEGTYLLERRFHIVFELSIGNWSSDQSSNARVRVSLPRMKTSGRGVLWIRSARLKDSGREEDEGAEIQQVIGVNGERREVVLVAGCGRMNAGVGMRRKVSEVRQRYQRVKEMWSEGGGGRRRTREREDRRRRELTLFGNGACRDSLSLSLCLRAL